jgi:hypothetical protein
VSYYFFSDEQLNILFAQYGFSVVSQKNEFFGTQSDPADKLGMMFTLFRKN